MTVVTNIRLRIGDALEAGPLGRIRRIVVGLVRETLDDDALGLSAELAYRWLLALNPMTGVIAGFRWALLGGYLADTSPPGFLFPVSILIALAVLASGVIFFRTTERTFADII